MITVLVQFKLPGQLTLKQAREDFEQAAPQFQNVDGLVRKYFLLSEDGKSAGGVYLWTREDLARKFHDQMRPILVKRFGSEPTLTFFRSPVIVDNALGKVEVSEAA
jgi:Putative mono-oxygenase ydhR